MERFFHLFTSLNMKRVKTVKSCFKTNIIKIGRMWPND